MIKRIEFRPQYRGSLAFQKKGNAEKKVHSNMERQIPPE
jgi:hypothetical protein